MSFLTPDQNFIETNGYVHCRACGMDVINEILCCYCNEQRIALGMGEIATLTQNQLDTLCAIEFGEEG